MKKLMKGRIFLKNSIKKYKHKLNMLEPGIKIIESIGGLLVAGILLYVFGLKVMSYLCFGISVLAALMLFSLLIIEHHQDEVMFREAKKADRKQLNPQK